MMELVSGAIHIFMWKDLEGSNHMSKIDPKETLKKCFYELKAIHVDEDTIVQFLYLNGRELVNQATEEDGMEDEGHIK